MSTAPKSNNDAKVKASSRIESKLHEALDAGQFYEAHQMYRTVYFRLCAQRKYGALLDLLYDGARRLLSVSDSAGSGAVAASGADLAILYVDVLTKGSVTCDSAIIDRLGDLYDAMLATSTDDATVAKSSDSDSRRLQKPANLDINNKRSPCLSSKLGQKFVANALSWSVEGDRYPGGSPALNARFAKILWSRGDYESARRHYLLADEGREFASFLIDYHQRSGFVEEADLFIAQAVLQLLCRSNLWHASEAFFHYIRQHPLTNQLREPPLATPLLDFLFFLLDAVRNRAPVNRLVVLVEKYTPSLSRDPCYAQYVDRIGQKFFGVPPPSTNQSAGQSFFANMLRDMFRDDDDGDDVAPSESGDATRNATVTHVDDVIGKSAYAPSPAGGAKSQGPAAKKVQEEDLD